MLSSKMYYRASGIVFAIVSLAHLARVVLGWNIVIGIYDIPSWLSLVAVVVSGYLSYSAFKLAGVLK
jgi:hypothetical protein